jgi:hypothetical protein
LGPQFSKVQHVTACSYRCARFCLTGDFRQSHTIFSPDIGVMVFPPVIKTHIYISTLCLQSPIIIGWVAEVHGVSMCRFWPVEYQSTTSNTSWISLCSYCCGLMSSDVYALTMQRYSCGLMSSDIYALTMQLLLRADVIRHITSKIN